MTIAAFILSIIAIVFAVANIWLARFQTRADGRQNFTTTIRLSRRRRREQPRRRAVGTSEVLIEFLAQALQAWCVSEHARSGEIPGQGSGETQWSQLPEDFHDANRNWAREVESTLAAVHCTIILRSIQSKSVFKFTESEVEMLAQRDHERWVLARLKFGWRWGAARDDAARAHPNILPWSQLPQLVRNQSRTTIKVLPSILASAGLDVARVWQSGPRNVINNEPEG